MLKLFHISNDEAINKHMWNKKTNAIMLEYKYMIAVF